MFVIKFRRNCSTLLLNFCDLKTLIIIIVNILFKLFSLCVMNKNTSVKSKKFVCLLKHLSFLEVAFHVFTESLLLYISYVSFAILFTLFRNVRIDQISFLAAWSFENKNVSNFKCLLFYVVIHSFRCNTQNNCYDSVAFWKLYSAIKSYYLIYLYYFQWYTGPRPPRNFLKNFNGMGPTSWTPT